jgi:predicted deacylase
MNLLERLDHPIKQLPSGDWLTLSMFRVNGTAPGPHVHIQANVHGAELQGNPVIYELMQWFCHNPFNGTVTFIPHANPIGVNNKMGTWTYGRFNPITGDNWNRAYEDVFNRSKEMLGGTLEEFVARHKDSSWSVIKQEFKKFLIDSIKNLETSLTKYGANENKIPFLFLQKVAATADIVLDLHTGPVAVRYIYSADYQREDVKHFNFPFVINIPSEFGKAMDEATFMNWVRLQQEFKKLGKEIPLEFNSFTVELGSEERISFSEAKEDALGILNYLHYKKVIQEKNWQLKPVTQVNGELSNYKTYYAPMGGMVEYVLPPGSRVEEGSVMARLLSFRQVKSAQDLAGAVTLIKAKKAGHIINHCPSGAVGQGAELIQVME